MKADKICNEVRVYYWEDEETYAKECAETRKGTWSDGPCPMENAVAECDIPSVGRTVFYLGAEDPERHCTQLTMEAIHASAE